MTDQHNDLREEGEKYIRENFAMFECGGFVGYHKHQVYRGIIDFAQSQLSEAHKKIEELKASNASLLLTVQENEELKIDIKNWMHESSMNAKECAAYRNERNYFDRLKEAINGLKELQNIEIERIKSDLEKAQARIKELEATKRGVSDEEIEQMAEARYTITFKDKGKMAECEKQDLQYAVIYGAKWMRDKLSPHAGDRG